MNTDAVLTLTQWLSPGFPVGAFAYSHGLERVIDAGGITSVATLEPWLRDIIRHGCGRSDLVLLRVAYDAGDEEVARIDAQAQAFSASSGRLTETCDQGAAFSRTVDAVWDTRLGTLTYPVALGRAAKLRGLPQDLTAAMYLHAFTANLISAAVRLVPLGQTEGQDLLARLAPLITSIADATAESTPDDLTSACFAADIASMQHETQYSKVFRT
ncbi:urease accessory protein UreF [Roseobacter ponti]|uniref:Urease accessory protein UreF n=1 Tax=Roseobacter ponti TaxID=1891787 RepID=A0A858SR60_9RHOB|nr:urease accessory UreF family protein [Roseobacter ponti]QJF50368.1 urease accessory protein UreF [Roseobacter ponti]